MHGGHHCKENNKLLQTSNSDPEVRKLFDLVSTLKSLDKILNLFIQIKAIKQTLSSTFMSC